MSNPRKPSSPSDQPLYEYQEDPNLGQVPDQGLFDLRLQPHIQPFLTATRNHMVGHSGVEPSDRCQSRGIGQSQYNASHSPFQGDNQSQEYLLASNTGNWQRPRYEFSVRPKSEPSGTGFDDQIWGHASPSLQREPTTPPRETHPHRRAARIGGRYPLSTDASYPSTLDTGDIVAAARDHSSRGDIQWPATRVGAAPGSPTSAALEPQPRKRGRPSQGQQPGQRQPKNDADEDSSDAPPRLVKKKRGAATLPDIVVPDYSQEQLKFGSQQQAWEESRDRLAALETIAWMPPANDTSIPQNDNDRKAVVRSLLGAMKDTSKCVEQKSSIFRNRWAPDAQAPYDTGDMEKVCWDILLFAERIHREGPQILNIYDTVYLKKIKKEGHYTFKQRIKAICQLMLSLKSRVDQLMRGDLLARMVIAPEDARTSSGNNKRANSRRSVWISQGKEATGSSAKPARNDGYEVDGSQAAATPVGLRKRNSLSLDAEPSEEAFSETKESTPLPGGRFGTEATAAGVGTAKVFLNRTHFPN